MVKSQGVCAVRFKRACAPLGAGASKSNDQRERRIRANFFKKICYTPPFNYEATKLALAIFRRVVIDGDREDGFYPPELLTPYRARFSDAMKRAL